MPGQPTSPDVHIEEVPSGRRPITGVATSITAFIGRALRGPSNKAIRVQSFAEFQRDFGGLWSDSTMSYAVQHYFLHGGTDAIIIRVAHTAVAAKIELPAAGGTLTLEASGPGAWCNALRASVNFEATSDPATLFTLTIQELETAGSDKLVTTETHLNLSAASTHPRYVKTVLDADSRLVKVVDPITGNRPDATITSSDDPTDATRYVTADGKGSDGIAITDEVITHPDLQTSHHGMYALDEVDLFNMLCIPPLERDSDGITSFSRAADYCKDKHAVLILDPPSGWIDTTTAVAGVNELRTTIGDASDHAAVYFPRLRMLDSERENRTATFAPCGAVAGIIARTDAEHGVWKEPAGIEAKFSGVLDLTCKLTDGQNGQLNQLGLNCIRSFPVQGNVIWGSRTLEGADSLKSDWKYLSIRRLALYIEESLYRGIHWVVFEPNDDPLWAEIRHAGGAFMNQLFRQGAFQGTKPSDAYFVKCDHETTTQADINLGNVNIQVGFAPLKPAEFVIIRIQLRLVS